MVSGEPAPAARTRGEPGAARPRRFERLGRAVVRHPRYAIAGWVVLFVVAVPFLMLLGTVTTNSTQSLPSSSPSAQAAARFSELFPNTSGAASATLLFYGPNAVGPAGEGTVLNVSAALLQNRSIADLASVANVYSAYAAYLTGEAEIASTAVQAAEHATPPLSTAANSSAALLWGPPAVFYHDWLALVNGSTGPAVHENAPAYNATAATYAGSPAALDVLNTFYAGYGNSSAGFNGSADCAATVAVAQACANATARANEAPLVPAVLPGANATALGGVVLRELGIGTYASAADIRTAAADYLGDEVGLPGSWIGEVWQAFPNGVTGSAPVAAWANATVAAATLASEPLAVPTEILDQFVAPGGSATVVQVAFSVADTATNASGGHPVYDDLATIDAMVPKVLKASDPSGALAYVATGPAPLDELSQQAITSSLALVLPLTIGLLLTISMLYFRSPVAPLVTFAGLGIALVLGLGGTVLLGTLVTHVDTTSLTLEEVFVLGVGTDYSIFLVARYREGIVQGLTNEEAIVASTTWAGQSVATSGSTAILVTLALTFSGVALLSQWGMVLSLAILITILMSLTFVPACLTLLGPRIFWPSTGARFARQAARQRGRIAGETTYFYRAGLASQRRPAAVVGLVALASIPLVAVALSVPISYNYYAQLPANAPANSGLAELGATFGPGFAEPSYVLVSFAAPLVAANNTTNVTEFTDVASVTAAANATAGIAVVRSPIGPFGGTLADWLALPTLPLAQRANLVANLSLYVGSDGRTVMLTLETTDPGLSNGAVSAVDSVRSQITGFAATHPEVTAVAAGGGATTVEDLADETNFATEVMLVAVAVGLVVVLVAVLRSWVLAAMAIATIGLSIGWAWALTDLIFSQLLGFPIFFYVRTILIMLVLGLGIDYNIFLLTRVREERTRGRSPRDAAVEAVGRTGGIITAAAVILASAFGALYVGEFTLIRAIGFSVAIAVVLDAMIVRTYLVPSALHLLGERAWTLSGRMPSTPPPSTGP